MTVNEIIQTIKTLSPNERIEIMHAITDTFHEMRSEKKHNILELEGLGADIWRDIDAQTYIDELRDEWD